MGTIKDKYKAELTYQDPTLTLTETVVGDMTDLAREEVTHSIDSVSDTGAALFATTGGPTLTVGQEVTISGFITNTAYNGIFNVTAVGANNFETGVAWGSSETVGSFIALKDRVRTLVADDGYKKMYESLYDFKEDGLASNFLDTVQTTDSTVTTISTIPLTDDLEYRITIFAHAIDGTPTDRAEYEAVARCSATAGTASVHASGDRFVLESTAAWGGITFTASGANILVRVTGTGSTTIDWTSQCLIEIIP